MHIRELRIGNTAEYLVTRNPDTWEEFTVSPATFNRMIVEPERFRGIPITDEILDSYGFEHEYTNGGFLKWWKGDFKMLDRRLSYPQYHHPNAMVIQIHQLQNLYFALTGQELTPNIA
jgi:hypothetical protein